MRVEPSEKLEDGILIADFGSQVTLLIARRLRERGIYCEVVPYPSLKQHLQSSNSGSSASPEPRGIILSGGPASIAEGDHVARAPDELFAAGIPILGICYGEQLLCVQLGGGVVSARGREFGSARIHVTRTSPLFEGVLGKGENAPVWMSHGDEITALPSGFLPIATSDDAPFAAIADETRRFYGVQFHPEVAHTPCGGDLLFNFARNIAGCSASWTMESFHVHAIARLRAQVGDSRVISAVSGGVDSSVASILLHEAIGENLHCIFVDNGLLRQDEAREVISLFRNHYDIPLTVVEAGERFLEALRGIVDPEEKRKRIGGLFIEIFEEEAKKLGSVDFLAQGTLYPDVIESLSPHGGPSVKIKSHHNVGGLPERMGLSLVEPLRDLFKDEVRALGRDLGIPEAFLKRHPFPGPGLAVRIPGEISLDKLDILRQTDAIYMQALQDHGLHDSIWQAFAALLPVRAVGVMGDARSYQYACALRAVTSSDGMTAAVAHLPAEFLNEVATRIVNQVHGVNRVLYDLTSKPPGTIEWE